MPGHNVDHKLAKAILAIALPYHKIIRQPWYSRLRLIIVVLVMIWFVWYKRGRDLGRPVIAPIPHKAPWLIRQAEIDHLLVLVWLKIHYRCVWGGIATINTITKPSWPLLTYPRKAAVAGPDCGWDGVIICGISIDSNSLPTATFEGRHNVDHKHPNQAITGHCPPTTTELPSASPDTAAWNWIWTTNLNYRERYL